jgi:hypothetical protein
MSGEPFPKVAASRVREMTDTLTPPYVDPATDRGGYDTDEMDALEAAARGENTERKRR